MHSQHMKHTRYENPTMTSIISSEESSQERHIDMVEAPLEQGR